MSVCDELVINAGTIEEQDLAKFVSERLIGRNNRRNKMILNLREYCTSETTELICHDLQVTEDWRGKTAYAVVESFPVGGVPEIRKVIFNDPATIVFWEDGTKTVVKCMEGDTFSREMGLAMCICKKVLGNNYHRVFKEWSTEEPKQKSKYKVGDRVRFWDGAKSRIGTIVKDDGSGRMQYIVDTEGNRGFYCYESREESINDVWYIEGLADE